MPATVCPLDCPDTCSLEVTVDAGRITRIDAAAGNPLTAGFICAKVKRHHERVHGPRRLTTPLLRDGTKGEGRFRPVSWDEAMAVVAARLTAVLSSHGPDAVVPFLYGSSGGVLAAAGLSARLWSRLGAAEVAHTICAASAGQAWQDTFGTMLSADPLDLPEARMVVVWGANPSVSNTHLLPLLTEARRRGAALVVVDPRRTPTAARADHHLAVRPGTDVVLALAMADHLRRAGLLATSFLDAHAEGVDAYLEAAAAWPTARAADVCGVPASDIEAVAEAYATTRPAFLRVGWGPERNRNGGSAIRAVLALPVLAGHFGVRGAGVMASLSAAAPVRDLPEPHGAPPRRSVPMHRLGALLADDDGGPRPRFLWVQGANPAATCPDQGAVLAGLAGEDLFTVVHEQVLTDTARYADVVLPATTHFEAEDLATSYGSFTLQRSVPVIPPVGESRSNDEVSADLARRLGFPAADFDPDPARLLAAVAPDVPADGRLRAEGTTVQLVDTFPGGPDHAAGRIRLHVPGGELPLPRYRPPADPPGAPDDRLTLITPATSRTINSLLGELGGPDPVLVVAPADAAARGVADGSEVVVGNELGELVLRVRVDPGMAEGVCSLPKGLWCEHLPGGRTPNALAPATSNDLAGGACFNDARVWVRPAG